MVLSTILLNFFGGTAFRLLWGEISNWWSASRDHKYEIERLRFQAEQDDKAHARRMEVMQFEAERGVKEIRVQGEVDLDKLDALTFGKGVELANQKSGIWLIDVWNGAVRPALATIMMALIVLHYYRASWTLDDRGWELAGAIFGVFIADRMLFKRGK